MTVLDLIEKLKTMPQDMEVKAAGCCGQCMQDIVNVVQFTPHGYVELETGDMS